MPFLHVYCTDTLDEPANAEAIEPAIGEYVRNDRWNRVSQSALRNRDYLVYITGATVSLHGLWIYRVALGWFAWELSASELWVGIVAFAQFAPAVLFGPIAGVFADRFDRRAVSVLLNSLSVVNMLILGFLTSLGHMDIVLLALLSLIQGTLDGAHAPVRMSIVPNLVRKDQLHSAIALTSVSFNLSRFIGPALAGLVIALAGVGTAFAVNGVSYLAMVVAMLVIRTNPSPDATKDRKHPWLELVEGLQYARSHEAIRRLLILAALGSVFGRGALEMLPVFADTVFSGGASALAVLTSAVGGGAVVAGVALSRGTRWLSIRVVNAGLIVAGLLIVLLSVIDRLELAVAVAALLGVTLSLCGVGSQILLQTRVDDQVRGRVSSFWGMIVFGGTSLGSLAVGAAASIWGLQNAVIATGAILAVATLLTLRARS